MELIVKHIIKYKPVILILTFWLIAVSTVFGQCYEDRHSTDYFDGWLSCIPTQSPNPDRGIGHWIQYELDVPLEIYQFSFWNLNDPDNINAGMKDYVIEHSLDGIDYTPFGEFTLEMGTGSSFYEGEEGPNMEGKVTKYILITALTNYDNSEPCFGFSEIKVTTSEVNVPLELIKLDIECKGAYPLITWEITNSLNQESISLENSEDGISWNEIYEQQLIGLDQNNRYAFDFLHQSAMPGTSYYRIKITDIDGRIEYSHIIESMCMGKKWEFEVFPIPSSELLTIAIENEILGNLEYNISDMLGKQYMAGSMEENDHDFIFQLNISEFPSGSYILTIKNQGISKRKTILKI